MLACDTNILFPAIEASHPQHAAARAWLEARIDDDSFALCELVLVEIYTLLRNPIICSKPLPTAAAVEKIDNLRSNPAWMVLDYPGPGLMEKVWTAARSSDSPRRIYDIRLGLTLRHYGVKRFATANAKDFRGMGFEKVWNPIG